MRFAALFDAARWNILRGIGPLALTQIVAVACGLLTTVIWTRMMPQDTFGEFRIVLALQSFAAAFCLVGLSQTAIMAASSAKDGAYLDLFRLRFLANLAGMAILLAAAGYYWISAGGSKDLIASLLISCLLFPIYNLSDLWASWLNGKSKFTAFAIWRSLNAAIPLALIAAAAVLGIQDLWPYVLALMIAICSLNLIVLLSEKSKLSNDTNDASILKFGHHTSAASLVSSLATLDVIILDHYYSPDEVAIYAIALQFPQIANMAIGTVAQAITPRIYRSADPASAWRDVRMVFVFTVAASTLMGAIGFYLLEFAVSTLFSDKYSVAAHHSKWLWLFICLGAPTSLLAPILLGTKRQLFVYVPSIGYPAIQALLYLALASAGISGLILARIVGSFCLFAFYVISLYLLLQATAPKGTTCAE